MLFRLSGADLQEITGYEMMIPLFSKNLKYGSYDIVVSY